MSRIKKFDNFIKSIYEVNVSGTYLDSTKLKGIVNSEFTTSVARKKYGKVFGDAPKTAGIDWGLKFVESSRNFFDIIFPDDFAKHFKTLARIHAEKIGNKSLDPVKTTSTLTTKTGTKIPINLLPPEYKDLGKYFAKSRIDVENIDFNILKGKQIVIEPPFNRTHFGGGIPEEFRGTGLGYIVYESFIKHLGFASSKSNASDKAKKVWSQIAQDPDFLSLVIVYDSIQDGGDVFVIYKNTTISNSELEEILKKYLSEINLDRIKEIRVDQDLKDRFPNINFEQGIMTGIDVFLDIFNFIEYDSPTQLKQVQDKIDILGNKISNNIEKYKEIFKNLNDNLESINIRQQIVDSQFPVNVFFSKPQRVAAIVSLLNPEVLDKALSKNFVSNKIYQHLQFYSLLLRRYTRVTQSRLIEELESEKSDLLKNDIKLFNNENNIDLISALLDFNIIFDIYVYHKKNRKETNIWDKRVNSYILWLLCNGSKNQNSTYNSSGDTSVPLFALESFNSFKVETMIRESYTDKKNHLKEVLDYLKEFNPNLDDYDKDLLKQSNDINFFGSLDSIEYFKKNPDKLPKEASDDIKIQNIVDDLQSKSEENIVKLSELIKSSKNNLEKLLREEKFRSNFIRKTPINIISRMFRQDIIKLSEIIENRKLNFGDTTSLLANSLIKIFSEKNNQKIEAFIDFLKKNEITREEALFFNNYDEDELVDSLQRFILLQSNTDELLIKLIESDLLNPWHVVEAYVNLKKKNNDLAKYIYQNHCKVATPNELAELEKITTDKELMKSDLRLQTRDNLVL